MTMDEMPEFKPSSLDQRVERALAPKKPEHHSFTDWDFQNANWLLDEAIYHTASPSLRGSAAGLALVKDAATGALSDGRVITWLRSHIASSFGPLYFRNQAADGTSEIVNTYRIYIQTSQILFDHAIAGVLTNHETKAHTWSWSIDTWYKFRVTWWTSVGRMYVRVERWTGTAWVTLGGAADTDFEDTDDRWKDETVNRVGWHYYSDWWCDDFEVWG